MNTKLIGLVLIIAGIAAMVWGYNLYDSASAQITRALSGDSPIEAWLAMIGGACALVFGLLKVK